MQDVPPEVVAAVDAWQSGRRKAGARPMERAKIVEIVVLTAQGMARNEIAERLGIALSTVYRVLDQLRQRMPKGGGPC